MKDKLIPTILVKNLSEFEERVKFLEKYFSLVQIDCADGKFVENKTFYEVNKINKVMEVNFELHLMVKFPLLEINKWLNNKRLKSIIFHYEAVNDSGGILNIINYLHKKKIKAGLAINPSTKVEKVKEFLPYLDELLVLGVNPGWGGKKFMPSVLQKIKKLRKLDKKINIGVDGGVNLQNAKQIVKAGANVLYAGKFLSDLNNIKKLKTNLGI
ncbi:ribulose-phosphate 3-epimerase [Candidatus Falkowbacteria bacterium]|nr:ribulose-phosphate 3-epimerase [Candidatus Falkowbacteria bacterium]